MLHLLWSMFKETGQINTYMLYKALEQENTADDSDTNVPVALGGDTAVGFYPPLEEQV